MADSYVVERRIHINAEPTEVFAHIVDLHKWESWSPWEGLDPGMSKTYEGPEAGVGSAYSWKGNRKVGEGRLAISRVRSQELVELDLEFLKPFKSRSTTDFKLSPSDGGTDVVWRMEGQHSWISKIMGIFISMDKMIGKDFDKGLAQLKVAAESAE